MPDQKNIKPLNNAPHPSQNSRNAIATPEQLPSHLCPDPDVIRPVVQAFPMRITPYFLSLIKGPDDALARQVIPDRRELQDPCTDADPLAEEEQSPAPLIVHRYAQRVIFLVSNQCAAYCRFCMRKRRVGTPSPVSEHAIKEALHYIRTTTSIHEVILSGGDPLMLSDDHLTDLLGTLKAMPHIQVLRIHTRVPCTLPARITPLLARRLSAFHPLYINIHCNHPDEITPQTARACSLLADAGISLGSQTVLLKGVNDHRETLLQLMKTLLSIRVRPYYLHQIDRVPGTLHFKVPIDQGLVLMAGLRGRLSGMAMPHYMIDLPGGGGKIELLPDHIVKKESNAWLVRNFAGQTFRYPLD
jgi:lysine 2,3-aminomutase